MWFISYIIILVALLAYFMSSSLEERQALGVDYFDPNEGDEAFVFALLIVIWPLLVMYYLLKLLFNLIRRL